MYLLYITIKNNAQRVSFDTLNKLYKYNKKFN